MFLESDFSDEGAANPICHSKCHSYVTAYKYHPPFKT